MGAVNHHPCQDEQTAAVCPEPDCDGGMTERRSETTELIETKRADGSTFMATRVKHAVYWVACHFCGGEGTVPVWKAAEWRAKNPSQRKVSGVMRRGGF